VVVIETYFGRVASAADREEVRTRLVALGFPFGDHDAQVTWCRQALRDGLIMRDAMTEQLGAGRPVDEIARACGVTPLRVYHYLSRGPDMETAAGDPWRLVYADEAREDAA
jgi:hypothetical protein